MTNLFVDGGVNVGGTVATSGATTNFKNLLIGGDAGTNPWCRGTTTQTGIVATVTYGADRWFVRGGASSSAQMVQSADTAVVGFNNSFKWGRGQSSGSVSSIFVGQALESNDSVRAQGQTLTLSFWARGDAGFSTGQTASTIGVQLSQGFGTDQGASALINGTWTSQTNPISTTQVITTTMTRYSFSGIISSTATQLGVLFNYTPNNTTAQTAENVIMNGVQLEIGSAASSFERRPIAVETALCQRYAWQLNEATGVILGVAVINQTNSAQVVLSNPVPMRAAPTVTVTQGSFGLNLLGTYTALTSMTATPTSAMTATINYVNVMGLATAISGQASLFTGTSTAGKITVSAEL